MAKHNKIGKWGEQIAVDILVSKGYAVRDRNWRMGRFELDIVAMQGNMMIFVEVKTRTSEDNDPLASVDLRKMRRIVMAANQYLHLYELPHEARYDVITISGTPSDYVVEHIEDAFYAPLRTY